VYPVNHPDVFAIVMADVNQAVLRIVGERVRRSRERHRAGYLERLTINNRKLLLSADTGVILVVIGVDDGFLNRAGTHALDQFAFRKTDDIQGFVGSMSGQKAMRFFVNLQAIESSFGARHNDWLAES
jgi:hypothetical protein